MISKPVEICNIFALGYRGGRGVVDDLAGARSEHDLHMDESDGQFSRIERAGGEQFVKVRRGYYLWAVGAAGE
jgi:hypothetical protein